MDEERIPERVARVQALTPREREELARLIGEAALDLWATGEAWPDLVERCLEAVEEDVAAGWVPVRVVL